MSPFQQAWEQLEFAGFWFGTAAVAFLCFSRFMQLIALIPILGAAGAGMLFMGIFHLLIALFCVLTGLGVSDTVAYTIIGVLALCVTFRAAWWVAADSVRKGRY
jgi:hypothetical protein